VAVYYYARIMKTMIIEESDVTARLSVSPLNQILIWIMVLPTIGLMIFWTGIEKLTQASVANLFFGR
jgi:NADH:ubiquinone oxidoreductase subunit 2 (subunit N)